jgi:hypothetical protein
LVLDWWHSALGNKLKTPPKWIFTSTIKKEQKKTEKENKFDDVEIFIRQKFELSKRELQELKTFFPTEYLSWVKSIQEQIGYSKKEE